MPTGVYNGPATFERSMQATMNDLIFQIMDFGMDFKYLDDILVLSKTFREHLERLHTAKMLHDTGLNIKIEKKPISPAKKNDIFEASGFC